MQARVGTDMGRLPFTLFEQDSNTLCQSVSLLGTPCCSPMTWVRSRRNVIMIPLPFAQVSAAQQVNLEVLKGMADVLCLSENAFSQFETLMAWNLQWLHGAMPGSYACTRQFLAWQRPRDVLAMQALAAQLASGRTFLPARAPASVPASWPIS